MTSSEPAESRLDRINTVWDSLPESLKDVLQGLAELGHRQPDLVEVLAGATEPKKHVDHAKLILDNTKALCSVIDLNGNIRYANNSSKVQHEKLTGRREVQNIAEFFEDVDAAVAMYRQVIETGEPVQFVQRTDIKSTTSGHDLFYFQIFPVQEFADTEPKQNLVGQILLPLGEVLSLVEGYLNHEESGGEIDYLAKKVKNTNPDGAKS